MSRSPSLPVPPASRLTPAPPRLVGRWTNRPVDPATATALFSADRRTRMVRDVLELPAGFVIVPGADQ